MTERKSDGGPEREDGEARGVSPPDRDPRRPWTLAQYGRAFRIPPDDAPIDVWRLGWIAPLATTWGALRPPPEYDRVYWWRFAETKEAVHMADEPRPPGDGWQRMWGDGSCLPEPGQDVEMWHCDWSGIRCINEFPERFSRKGIWWRPLKADQGPSQDDPRPLPSWARQPMIDSAAVKHRIVHAWHAKDGTLFTLGSDGRIWFFDCGVGWRAPDVYPPGLEP